MSEQYIVSARKYRPQTFDTVVGQQHITTTLKNAVRTQHLAHAYLFCGPRGVGKTTCARILAKTINCLQPTPDMEACGVCATCLSFQDNASFNIFELDAASNNSVDDIRSLTEQVRYAPQQGKYKVYIIDEVHMLSTSAFNAFLKTLEEPPAYAIFILATTEKHKILPTILSRCQIFDFRRIQTEDIVGHLASICTKEAVAAETAGLHVIAQKSEGCMRDALSMMDRIAGFTNGQLTYAQTAEHLNILDADTYFTLGDVLLSKDLGAALVQVDAILQRGFEGDVLLNGFQEHFRNLLLSKDVRMAQLLDVPEDHRRIYFEKAAIIPSEYILSALQILNEAELGFKNALNKRLHLELCFIKLCYLQDIFEVKGTGLDGSEVKKKPKSSVANTESQQAASLSAPIDTNSFVQESEVKEAAYLTPAPQPATVAAPSKENVADVVQHSNIEQQIPVPSATIPVAANIPTSNSLATDKRPKLGKHILSQLQQKSMEAQSAIAERMELNEENVKALFAEYKLYVRNHLNQTPMFAQLELMQISVLSPSTVQLMAVSKINMVYAENQRDTFIEFFKSKTNIPEFRVAFQMDATIPAAEPETKGLTKLETYELMVNDNPALKLLRDELNLQF